ncbi:GNAT family acetyltransferase [Parasphingopyxis algicola]|uniref:GNAT family acetyltransferase n=1 Tax=Parasphingopyxis algicola TaxID=2026624 RepID=UPI0015A2CB30|nr:GNAT family acetyltransferase [Parasphingopyxis algicola]QLC26260.1 GNAT family acetyltransferase [Parasphingopyxis algicola]
MADSGPKLSVAGRADRDAVIGLWRDCALTRPWNDPVADFAAAIGNPTSDILLLAEGDTPIATVMVGFDGHRGWVYYLAVHPGHRRRGLGGRMMKAAEAWLRERGSPKIQLMVRSDNADVIAFYEALGLERQDVVTLGRRLDHETGA